MAYFSNKLTKKEMEEIVLNNPVMQEVLKAESYFTQDEINRRKYEQREKAIRDHYSFLAGALEEGMEKGLEKGRAEGEAKGRAEGRAEGRTEGEEKMVRAFLAAGAPMEMIKKATGWTEEQILKLQ